MIGIDIGSLNTVVSLGKQNPLTSRFQCELILSDTSSRSCPSILSFTENLRLIGDQASLGFRSYMKSSFQYLSRLIGIVPNSNFGKKELNEYYTCGGTYDYTSNDSEYKRDLAKKPYLDNAFVNFKSTDHSRNSVSRIYGAGHGRLKGFGVDYLI